MTHRSRVYEAHGDVVPFQVPGHRGTAAIERCLAHPVPVLQKSNPAVSLQLCSRDFVMQGMIIPRKQSSSRQE